MSDSCSPSQALWECFKVRKGNLWHCDEYFASVWMSLRMMTSVPWIQSAWGEVLSAHRRSCHRGGKPEESWEKMIVRDNFCTSLHPGSPKNWSLSPFHPCPWVTTILDKSSPEEWRWLSLSKKHFSMISLRCSIQKLDPNCHHRHGRWLVTGVIMVLTVEGSISRIRRGQSLEEKQKGTEPRPISIIWAAASTRLLCTFLQCNAMECNEVQCKGKLCAIQLDTMRLYAIHNTLIDFSF